MSSSIGSHESSPAWVVLGRPRARPRARAPVAAPAPQFRVGRRAGAQLLGAAAAAAAVGLAWIFLLAAVAAPAARLLP